MNTEKPYQNLIGLTKSEAVEILEKERADYRIMEEGFCYTCEYVASRISVVIKNGLVENVRIG